MPTLSITKTYKDGDVLFEADFDNIKNDIENFVNVTKLDGDNFQDAGIDASLKFIDSSISSDKMGVSAVTTIKINDSAVTTAKINDSAVTTAKINDSAVTTAKINDSAVTTAKINDGAVTNSKKGALNYALSSSCGSFATTSSSYTDVTNLSVSFTTTGKLLHITMVPDGSSSAYMTTSGTSSTIHYLRLDIGGAGISESEGIRIEASSKEFNTYETYQLITAGTYTFKIQAKVDGGASFGIFNYKLLVYEEF